MATPAAKILYDTDRKKNLLSSGQGVGIPLVDRIAAINDFLQIWFSNSVKEAERNQEAANEIRVYKEPLTTLALTQIDENTIFARYPDNLHTRLNQIAIVSEPTCCEGVTKMLVPKILTSDQIHTARKNPLQKSSFYFERLNAEISNKGLTFYHDGSCRIDKVQIEYYRKPIDLHVPSHEECGGRMYYDYIGQIITEDTYFESDSEFAAGLISDGATLLLTADKNEPEKFELQLKKILQSRNIYSVRD